MPLIAGRVACKDKSWKTEQNVVWGNVSCSFSISSGCSRWVKDAVVDTFVAYQQPIFDRRLQGYQFLSGYL